VPGAIDGASFALNADLSVAAQLPAFEENITTVRWSKTDTGWRGVEAGQAPETPAARATAAAGLERPPPGRAVGRPALRFGRLPPACGHR
jgi:hypothetical protein